jgi:hypothetical protein
MDCTRAERGEPAVRTRAARAPTRTRLASTLHHSPAYSARGASAVGPRIAAGAARFGE